MSEASSLQAARCQQTMVLLYPCLPPVAEVEGLEVILSASSWLLVAGEAREGSLMTTPLPLALGACD